MRRENLKRMAVAEGSLFSGEQYNNECLHGTVIHAHPQKIRGEFSKMFGTTYQTSRTEAVSSIGVTNLISISLLFSQQLLLVDEFTDMLEIQVQERVFRGWKVYSLLFLQ